MKTIIFDMYGVVIKAPEGDLVPYVKSKFPDKPENDINSLWKESAYGRISSETFFQNIGFTENIKAVEREYLETIAIDEIFYKAAKSLKSKFQMALLSNDISEWSQYLQDKFYLNEYFDEIVISGDTGFLKPDIKIFELLLKKLKKPASECYYVDDREKNLRAAEQLGMQVILFNRRKVSYNGIVVKNFHELSLYFDNLKQK